MIIISRNDYNNLQLEKALYKSRRRRLSFRDPGRDEKWEDFCIRLAMKYKVNMDYFLLKNSKYECD